MSNPAQGESIVEILMVEDDGSDEKLALRALRRRRIANRVHVVRDGAEALEFLFGDAGRAPRWTSEGPRVVLLDLKLPKVDGLEVLRRIRADERTRLLPVVILTSSAEDRDVVESYRLGVNSYIVKPVDFAQFTEAVQTIGLYWVLMNRPPSSGGLD